MAVIDTAYSKDPRVRFNNDGTVTVPDKPGGTDGNRHIEPAEGGGWTARNDADQGWITDPGDRSHQRKRVFNTVDGALFYMIGDPK